MAVAAAIGLLGIVASITAASPAAAGERVCIDATWGGVCVTPVQHLDGAQFDGIVTDHIEDDNSIRAVIWVYIPRFEEWRKVGDFFAFLPDLPNEVIDMYIPGPVPWMQVELCRFNQVTRERQCFASEAVPV